MAEKHIFNRLAEAQAAQRDAAKTATDLVDRLQKAALSVCDSWQFIEFVTRDESDQRKGRAIVIDEVPSMEDIRLAVDEWRKARDLVVQIENELTSADRQTLDTLAKHSR